MGRIALCLRLCRFGMPVGLFLPSPVLAVRGCVVLGLHFGVWDGRCSVIVTGSGRR